MIDAITKTLKSHGWFDSAIPHERQFHLTRGGSAFLILTRGGVFETYVKFSESVNFYEEALRSRAANFSYPSQTAQFKGRAVAEGIDMLVSQAVNCLEVRKDDVLSGTETGKYWQGLNLYFSSMVSAKIPLGVQTVKNVDLPKVLENHFENHPLRAVADHWLNQEWIVELTKAMHSCPQHGDFVLNNIGISSNGLVLFDWEDFGRILLPGIDIYSLLISIGLGRVRRIQDCKGCSPQFFYFVKRQCLNINITVRELELLIPIYLLTLLYMRRSFGRTSLERLESLLVEFTYN